MFVVDGIAYPNQEIGEKVREYLDKGFDLRTADYLATGRTQILSVVANDDFTLSLRFDNGEIRNLDCKPILEDGTVFQNFKRIEDFKRVYIDDCHCVSWDIDPDADSDKVCENKVDLCPDYCYLKSVPVLEGGS